MKRKLNEMVKNKLELEPLSVCGPDDGLEKQGIAMPAEISTEVHKALKCHYRPVKPMKSREND
jgi:hypothetical protein